MSAEAYGTDWMMSTITQAMRSGPAFCGVLLRDTAHADSNRPAIMSVSSRAAASACHRPAVVPPLGVRKNGSLLVSSPLIEASPMVAAAPSPAAAAAIVWRRFAPTRTRYRCVSLASLKVNSDSGSTEYSTRGGSIEWGAHTMAADQGSAARLKSTLTPSAIHGSQPAMK